jgi:uncharacterized protein YktB (UPF0637 family)
MLSSYRYKILRNLQFLQEQDEKNTKFIKYKAALARENGKADFTVAGKTYKTSDYFGDPDQKADKFIDDFEKEKSMPELSKLDDFVESLDERKKRRKRRKKPKPNVYQRKKYKARSGTRRGDTMARLSDKIRRGKKLTKADYKARDDSEAAERKKKGYKSKPRFDTGMYLSEAMKRELDEFVELLDEKKRRKKRRKKRKSTKRKSSKRKKKSSAGGLSAATKETLKKKAKRRGLTPSSVYAEYRKGLAAYYSSGSRKGMSAHQWAHARVNSANPSKSWAVVKKAKGGKKK